MASTYSNLKIQLMATGENSTTWGAVTNTNLGTALEEAIVGSADVTFASGDVTLTLTDTNSTQTARNLRLNLTGTTGAARNLIVPAIEKIYLVNNGCADAVTVKNSTGTGIAVPAGKTMWVYNNATNVVDAVTHLTSLTLGAALPVASGGTGQTSFTNGQLLIGNTTGNTLTKATLTAGTGISVTNGNGSITLAATNTGTVTSVNGSGGTTGLTLTGGPVTTTGTLTLGGTLAVANGGTGVTGSTGTGSVVLSAAPTFTGTATFANISTTNVSATLVSSTNVNASSTLTAANVNASSTVTDSLGNVRTIVQNSQTTGYTLVATDSGKHVSITTGGVTVPASVFSAGQAVTIYNNSASSQTLTQASGVTMYLAGTATTGNRTLAQRGLATVLCTGTNAFVIAGGGLT